MEGTRHPGTFRPSTRQFVQGIYRYVRNPMYWAAFLILAGQGILFGVGRPTVIYIACFVALVLVFVRFYEEPAWFLAGFPASGLGGRPARG